ncbi:MAG TPA: heavy metal-associated domain-containing protein [Acidiferrobacterales bacterium]|jgi:Au+-exporting ATPase
MTTTETVYSVNGMKCGGCVANAEAAIRAVPGVVDVKVELAAKSAVVKGSADPAAVVAALARAGYPAQVVS